VRDGQAYGENAAEYEGPAVIALVDYGAGNLTSVRKALATLGAGNFTPRHAGEIAAADGVIVPGVGHFATTHALGDDWREAIQVALARGAALFGICLGMQWLFDGSEEAPDVHGLGVFSGRCHRLDAAGPPRDAQMNRRALKVPHVGWNSLEQPRDTAIMRGVPTGAHVYFTHSYVAPVVADTAAVTCYGVEFSAAVARQRIAGVQFHPEKSGDVGLRILRNWLESL
jgi:glutamine amidotransferase